MYQVTWTRARSIPHQRTKYLETWTEVQDLMTNIQGNDDLLEVTIALVLDSDDNYLKSIVLPNIAEKGQWVNNLTAMMPDEMDNYELSATMMSLASNYMTEKDMKNFFAEMVQVVSLLNKNETELKRSMH